MTNINNHDYMHTRVDNDFGFHPANEKSRPLHEATRLKMKEMAHFIIDNVPGGREQQTALTHLQMAAMWCNAGIACNLAPLEEAKGSPEPAKSFGVPEVAYDCGCKLWLDHSTEPPSFRFLVACRNHPTLMDTTFQEQLQFFGLGG